MSKYTTELRFICETYAGYTESQGYSKVEEIIQKSRSQVFDFPYPIFDEAYRSVLETKIIRHFYTREICAETVGRWKLFLNAEMNEIMPYFNKLYASELLKFNPLYDVNLTTDYNKKGEGQSTSENQGESKGENWRYYHDTPQGGVEGLKSLRYLTEAERNDLKSNTTSESEGAYTNTEDYLKHVVGKSGGASYSKLLVEYRDTFLNIDMLVIKELEDLFFGLW